MGLGLELFQILLCLANITSIFQPFWVDFSRARLKPNHSQATVLLAFSLEEDVNSKQGFIYPHRTAKLSVENELFLASGKNVSPPVAAEVLFLFPQQQHPPTTRASDQVHDRQQQQQRASEQPQDPATTQIHSGMKGRKDDKTNKQRKRHFCCYGYRL